MFTFYKIILAVFYHKAMKYLPLASSVRKRHDLKNRLLYITNKILCECSLVARIVTNLIQALIDKSDGERHSKNIN